jgi:hypothetical protein
MLEPEPEAIQDLEYWKDRARKCLKEIEEERQKQFEEKLEERYGQLKNK